MGAAPTTSSDAARTIRNTGRIPRHGTTAVHHGPCSLCEGIPPRPGVVPRRRRAGSSGVGASARRRRRLELAGVELAGRLERGELVERFLDAVAQTGTGLRAEVALITVVRELLRERDGLLHVRQRPAGGGPCVLDQLY